MEHAIEHKDPGKVLDLANIRAELIRLEDSIVFHLLERVQFPLNATIYQPSAIPIPNSNLSLLDYILHQTERLHSLVRRYQSPDEYPFFPSAIEEPILKPLNYPKVLHENDVVVNDRLKDAYISKILPACCSSPGREDRGEQEENYGSAATADVLCLQSLSRRIHYGKFVAESKFRSATSEFVALIKAKDVQGLDAAITDARVEAKVLERLRLKAKTYGTDPDSASKDRGKIDVEAVVAMYKDYVIPLTKVVEVDYLLQRLKGTEWE